MLRRIRADSRPLAGTYWNGWTFFRLKIQEGAYKPAVGQGGEPYNSRCASSPARQAQGRIRQDMACS